MISLVSWIRNPWDRALSCFLGKVAAQHDGVFARAIRQDRGLSSGAEVTFSDFLHWLENLPPQFRYDSHLAPFSSHIWSTRATRIPSRAACPPRLTPLAVCHPRTSGSGPPSPMPCMRIPCTVCSLRVASLRATVCCHVRGTADRMSWTVIATYSLTRKNVHPDLCTTPPPRAANIMMGEVLDSCRIRFCMK